VEVCFEMMPAAMKIREFGSTDTYDEDG